MSEAQSIKYKEPSKDILDLEYMKQTALEKIQELAGNNWTDFNFHDPGVTILEVLAYSLTELGYRSQYPVQDILTTQRKKIKDSLFAPSEILSSNALTITDFHKIVLDIEGVKDVIMYPSTEYPEFSGIYEINIELFPDFDTDESKERIKKLVFSELHSNRNLCETFNKVHFIEHEYVAFEIEIDANDEQDIASIYVDIYADLTEYLSPSVNFYSLQDLEDMNLKVGDIFNGPLLKSGFILESDFERIDSRNKIFASDIIHFIMDVKGVEMIKTLKIIDSNGQSHKWFCSTDKGKAYKLDMERTKIQFYKVGKQIELKDDISQELSKIDDKEDNRLMFKRLTFNREEGSYRELKEYFSILNDFPDVYGIGEMGLAKSEKPRRKAQAKQLKAYLMFFEQILTNFFAQLEHLNLLFSIERNKNTYYTQALDNIPGIEYMYQDFIKDCIQQNIDIADSKNLRKLWVKNKSHYVGKIEKSLLEIIESQDTFYDRRNRVLDHLLARMAFDYSRYRFDFMQDLNVEKNMIKHKIDIIENFIPLSKQRGQAFNVLDEETANADNISGLEHRINSLLRLSGTSKLFPLSFYREGTSLEKYTGKDVNSEDLAIVMRKAYKSVAMELVFKYATDISNFEITEEDNIFKAKILDGNKESFGSLKNNFESKEEIEKAIAVLSETLDIVSAESESIHVIERILYRPHLKMNYFTFAINNKEGIPIYINDGYLDFYGRKSKVELILKQAETPENYGYSVSNNQYKITINAPSGEVLVSSHKFFNSKAEADQEISDEVEFFGMMNKGILVESDYFEYYTKHYDLFNISEDPYSFIATILIPSWPKKFQNPSFKTHLENTVRNEMPAHIYPDIKWVDVSKLVAILELCATYDKLLKEEALDIEKLSETSDALFRFFVK